MSERMGAAMPRAPAVAGRFYPDDPDLLRREVATLMGPVVEPRPALALVGPHAGYVYSGSILGQTYARVVVPRRVVLMCPNHTGRGVPRSSWSGGAWRLPTGTIPIDEALSEAIVRQCGATPDRAAHLREHALEVHLPFALARQPDLSIAALCLAGLDLDECRDLGEGLAQVVRESDEPVLLVASTDMSHYVCAAEAATLDRMALSRVEALDPEGLYRTVRTHRISMCGVLPTTVALFAARALGAREAELVRYGHSGERSGDLDRVVGYAGVVVR
ncbi:AmmeMemoRadiSam system protein B [Paraliomyxa miuraensis]|uniref:AmmeMemoRadiSam system protein B n=1 Tax=Paraliomyxa miuraensis TaxID=376150 RepID=UPI00225238D8|nr:AmmeMemoRadiSam system protein B [Paraliomyxa miuraensis]MCX4242149.1 AmmeMemoRadiSam system protein B [Paraliomyxa miuraensis]